MRWRWEEKTRRTPWQEEINDPLIDQLQTYLGAGNISVLRKAQPDSPRCLVHVNTTVVAGRAMLLLDQGGVDVVPVVGLPPGDVPGQTPRCVLLNLARMNALLSLDTDAQVAHVQGGSRWRRLEFMLRRRNLTLGPLPHWLFDRCITESVARNDMLRPSPAYGQLTDQIMGLAVVLPRGVIARTGVAPRRATGPDLWGLMLGARHKAGLLTEVHLQLYPVPTERHFRAAILPHWGAAMKAAHSALMEQARPAWWCFEAAGEGRVKLLCGFEGGAEAVRAVGRFDRALEARGLGVEAGDVAEAEALYAETFPEPTPDPPKKGTDAPPPPPARVEGPVEALPELVALVEGARVWDVAAGRAVIHTTTAPDEAAVALIEKAGGRVLFEKGPEASDAWSTVGHSALERLSGMAPANLRPEDLPERPLRAGSPF